MREIRFRAWDKKYKILHPVVSLICWVDRSAILQGGCVDDVELDLDEIELMQFTGLHDKNGKEIYEGDILQVGGGILFTEKLIVKWGECDYGFVIHCLSDGSYYKDLKDCQPSKVEVIGNIYENGELLNGN